MSLGIERTSMSRRAIWEIGTHATLKANSIPFWVKEVYKFKREQVISATFLSDGGSLRNRGEFAFILGLENEVMSEHAFSP